LCRAVKELGTRTGNYILNTAGNKFLALEYNEKNLPLSCQNERKVKFHFVEESNISCIFSSGRSSNIWQTCPHICVGLCYHEANETLTSVIRASEMSGVYNLCIWEEGNWFL